MATWQTQYCEKTKKLMSMETDEYSINSSCCCLLRRGTTSKLTIIEPVHVNDECMSIAWKHAEECTRREGTKQQGNCQATGNAYTHHS